MNEEPAIRVLAQEYLAATRPGVRLDDLNFDELADLLGNHFLRWRDAHPNRQLVERQLREQGIAEDELIGELNSGMIQRFLENPEQKGLIIEDGGGQTLVMERDKS